MNVNQIDYIYENYPNFRINAIRILHLHKEYISIYQFENEYIEAFNEEFSPLIHCNTAEKAMVLTTLPYVRVKLVKEYNPILGIVRYKVSSFTKVKLH